METFVGRTQFWQVVKWSKGIAEKARLILIFGGSDWIAMNELQLQPGA